MARATTPPFWSIRTATTSKPCVWLERGEQMASVRKDFIVNAPADQAWDALADFGAVHTRLAPGFVIECRLEDGHTRIVTFA
ncbi:MAG: SRPBCC family protein, partial [Xanthobacteraceae bacterium]